MLSALPGWLVANIFVGIAVAAEAPPMSFGHNLTHTSHVLNSDQCTLGLKAAACGLKGDILLGFSPWLITDYEMGSYFVRQRFPSYEANTAYGFELAYVKSFNSSTTFYEAGEVRSNGKYKMELLWLHLIKTNYYSEFLATHLDFQVMGFIDDQKPFSLRRPWMDRRALQFNIGYLAEMHLHGPWYANMEIGLLGLVQTHRQVHLGMSYEYRNGNFQATAGLTHTGTPASFADRDNRFDCQGYLLKVAEGFHAGATEYCNVNDYSVHPEFNVQYFF